MHDQEKPSQSAIPGTHERPLEESSKILHAMVVMSNRLGRPMSGDRMDQLLADLAHYPVRGIEWALDKILSKPLTLGSERRALDCLKMLGVKKLGRAIMPKPRRTAGKLTLKQARQLALKVAADTEAGIQCDRADHSSEHDGP